MPNGNSFPCSRRKGAAAPMASWPLTPTIWESNPLPISTCCCRSAEAMTLLGLAGILIGLGLLIWLAYRGWSVLLLAPLAAMITALFSGEPLLAHWTQTFMGSAATFLSQFFPIFLLG